MKLIAISKLIETSITIPIPILLTIIAVIVGPLLIWAVKIERRFERVKSNEHRIEDLEAKTENMSIKNVERFDEIIKMLHKIELALKDKKDKKDT